MDLACVCGVGGGGSGGSVSGKDGRSVFSFSASKYWHACAVAGTCVLRVDGSTNGASETTGWV